MKLISWNIDSLNAALTSDSARAKLSQEVLQTLVAMLLVTISKYQTNQASNNQFQTSLHFIEVVSKDLGVDKSEVYVNTSAATDGALVKVGPNFYRAMNGSQPDKYLLEKLELNQTDAIELVEVNK